MFKSGLWFYDIAMETNTIDEVPNKIKLTRIRICRKSKDIPSYKYIPSHVKEDTIKNTNTPILQDFKDLYNFDINQHVIDTFAKYLYKYMNVDRRQIIYKIKIIHKKKSIN